MLGIRTIWNGSVLWTTVLKCIYYIYVLPFSHGRSTIGPAQDLKLKTINHHSCLFDCFFFIEPGNG